MVILKKGNSIIISVEKFQKSMAFCVFPRIGINRFYGGHYADKHKGIAIGFKILKDKIPFEVKYRSVLKRIKFELTDNEEENKKLFLNLAEIKSEDWSYEKEYRMLVKLDDCDKGKNKSFYLMNFTDKLK